MTTVLAAGVGGLCLLGPLASNLVPGTVSSGTAHTLSQVSRIAWWVAAAVSIAALASGGRAKSLGQECPGLLLHLLAIAGPFLLAYFRIWG